MRYLKVVGAIVFAGLSFLAAALTDGQVTTAEWINLVLTLTTAVSVWLVPNLSSGVGKYAKAVIAVVLAVGMLLIDLITDGLTSAELIQLGLAALTAVGVGVLPNKGYVLHVNNARPANPATGG